MGNYRRSIRGNACNSVLGKNGKAKAMMLTDRPMTVAQVAERWDCSTHAVYALIRAKRLPAFRVGGKLLRIQAKDVAAWESAGGNTQSENTDLGHSTDKKRSFSLFRSVRVF